MSKYGLVGKKLVHSLSPLIHNNVFQKLNLSGEYSLYEIENEKDILKKLRAEDVVGFNITIPYKEVLLEELDYISEEAKKIGAINLVRIEDGKTYGYNSDYFGFIKMLEEHSVEISKKSCYVLGSGGAAKSVIVALNDLGAKEIVVVTRDVESKKAELKRKFKNIIVVSYEDIIGGEILINTTPVGMYPNTLNSPVTEDILKRFDVAIDLIYNPADTKFLRLAKKNGLKCVNGISMLVNQAIKSDEVWKGITVDRALVEELEELVEKELRGEKL